MLLQVKISKLLILFAIFLFILPLPTLLANMGEAQFNKGLETFGIRLFTELAKTNRNQNIVFSPFSIQTCIAMARMGAEGKTALEMDEGLALSAQNREELANSYQTVLALYENSSILKIANKIFVMQGYGVQETFNELLTKKFFSSAGAVNFANSASAAHTINSWVEGKTNNLIKNLVSPQVLDANTRLVLVNAIHFKGEWQHQFPKHGTREMDFYLDETNSVKVQMMHIKERFRYGEFPELDAKTLEMPYKDSDVSMFIFLPNSRNGLIALEEKLKSVSLSDISQYMFSTKVIVDMPKFKAEFEVEMSEHLKKLGMSRMFTGEAEFGKMLKSTEPFQVSKVIHKAFIEVNEKGTEAAAATGTVVRKKRALEDFSEIKEFNIDHPFVFKILQKPSSSTTSSLILFAGRIEKIIKLSTTEYSSDMKDEL